VSLARRVLGQPMLPPMALLAPAESLTRCGVRSAGQGLGEGLGGVAAEPVLDQDAGERDARRHVEAALDLGAVEAAAQLAVL